MNIPSDEAGHAPRTGRIVQIGVSRGGVPKLPVSRAWVGPLGLHGDSQRNRRLHGGPRRALCLFSMDVIERLQVEGHPIAPGTAGENLTIAGLDFAALCPGDRLCIGGSVMIELTNYTAPCKNVAASFADGDPSRTSHKLHPGESRMYARVVQEGEIATGDPVWVAPAG